MTGTTGPTGGTEAVPVGTLFVAVSGPGVDVVEKHFWPFDRERIRRWAAWQAMDLCIRCTDPVA